MTEFSLFATAALAHLLAVMSPGPDFAMVTRQTLIHGRRAGVWTALGIGSGIVAHVAYGLFGLGWLLGQWPWLLETLRYAGAGFLLWLGLQGLLSRPAPPGGASPRPPPSARRSYLIGLLTNLLNPKAALFFVALFASVITTETSSALRWALGAWVVLTTAAWFALVATLFSTPRLQRRLQGAAPWLDRGTGGLLVALAAGMLLA